MWRKIDKPDCKPPAIVRVAKMGTVAMLILGVVVFLSLVVIFLLWATAIVLVD
jgi:hypothetical protein